MIVIDKATKVFGDKVAVTEATFTAADGGVTYLLGPNGAGKTTLLRMVAGLSRPTSGTVHINGLPHNKLSRPLNDLGMCLGSGSVNPKLTAAQHLRWQARLGGVKKVDENRLLRLVGLASAANRPVGTFSYGMLQRLGIASALVGDSQTIVLDEPANGLDVEGILWLRSLVARLAADGRCVLVASHNLPEVELTASQVVIMARGAVLANAPLADLVDSRTGTRRLEDAYLEITRRARTSPGSHAA